MARSPKTVAELEQITSRQFFEDVVTAQRPVVFRNINRKWPVVKAALRSTISFISYLRSFCNDSKVRMSFSPPESGGNYSYSSDLKGLSFLTRQEKLSNLLEKLASQQSNSLNGHFSIQSANTRSILPGFLEENYSSFFYETEPRFWLGNQGRVATHYDNSDNLACVIAGRRRFTLFPPDQICNLYPGPIDFTPAGTPVSLVDFNYPDYKKYPRFKNALANSYCVELAPGDAIFIPMLWWHHVEALDNVNALMNYWWTGALAKDTTAPYLLDIVKLAILGLSERSDPERNEWRQIFKYAITRKQNSHNFNGHFIDEVTDTLSDRDKARGYFIERLRNLLGPPQQ